MARVNNLTNFLNDVATAIKQKTGNNTPIPASEFDTEILSIETGGNYQSKSISITTNGNYNLLPDQEFDALSNVNISVSVSPILQNKTIRENGSYSADSGYDGLGTVIVNVPSGSGDIKLFETEQAMQADPDASEGDLAVVYREEIQPVTEESEFDSCIFPNTVILDTAFSDSIYGRFRAVDSSSSYFDGMVDISSSRFRFTGYGDSGEVIVQYTSSDGITYTRTDGGEELQEFGVTIKYEPMRPWNDVLGNFMKIGGNIFDGLFEYKSNEYVMTKNQLNATPDYVYEKTFYGKNGVEVGTLTTSVSNSFADINAEVVYKIQQQYENMTPRVLTNSDKTIDKNIYFIPAKKDGTLLLDTSNVTNMDSMFGVCSNLTLIPLLDTSNVTSMVYMFQGCSNLTTIPLLDTSNVTSMSSMFVGCSSLTAIPLLNTGNVTNMVYMFTYCESLTTIPLLDTSNVTNMHNMFQGCSNLTTIPLLDTSNVTEMYSMFESCSNLTSIPLLNTGNVTYMSNMFSGCSSLTTIPLLDTSNVTRMDSMFSSCSSLNNESLNNILAMCTNAVKITYNKTLKYIGLTEEQANICKTLSNYQDFVNAGWTTGY